jgi:hypothetical protein
MRLRSLILAIALLLLAPAVARAQMPQNGFVFEARVAATLNITAINSPVSAAVPSIFAGGRIGGRVQLGLGFSIFRISTPVTDTTSNDLTSFDFAPTIAIDFVKSNDQHVAFYGKAGIPMGASLNHPAAAALDSRFLIGYDAALGVRYSPHHMFAIGAEGGVFGVFVSPGQVGGVGVTSAYGAIVGTFYYGK